jgi:hypothetical protein
MDTLAFGEHDRVDLLEIIDFKWLMSRDGHHIHVQRLQNDPAYAAACFAQAAASPIALVRQTAERLMRRLDVSLARDR